MKSILIALLIITSSVACGFADDFETITSFNPDEKCTRVVKCEICGKEIVEEYDCYCDHIFSWSVTVCPHCHYKYGEKWQAEFEKLAKKLLKSARDDEKLRREHHEKTEKNIECDELRKELKRFIELLDKTSTIDPSMSYN